jgi:hypothetical protein
MGATKKRRRLWIKWTVFELLSLGRDGEGMSLTPCTSVTGSKTKAQRWIREAGYQSCEYVILPVYEIKEVE